MLVNRKKIVTAIAGWAVMAGMTFAAPLESSSPVGFWKTIDDVTGKPKSIVQISKGQDSQLIGKVVRLFPKQGEDVTKKVCKACAGSLHDKPIVGMEILKGLVPDGGQWVNGKILDPANGKTYSCSARLAANGEKLRVRGFIGMPLFGRSQTWERVDLVSAKG